MWEMCPTKTTAILCYIQVKMGKFAFQPPPGILPSSTNTPGTAHQNEVKPKETFYSSAIQRRTKYQNRGATTLCLAIALK